MHWGFFQAFSAYEQGNIQDKRSYNPIVWLQCTTMGPSENDLYAIRVCMGNIRSISRLRSIVTVYAPVANLFILLGQDETVG